MAIEWLGLGAVAGVVAGFWQNIKWWIARSRDTMIETHELRGIPARGFVSYCMHTYTRGRLFTRLFDGLYLFQKGNTNADGELKPTLVAVETIGDTGMTFWCGRWRTLRLQVFGYGEMIRVTFVRGMFDIEQLIDCAVTRERDRWEYFESIHQGPNLSVIERTGKGPIRCRISFDGGGRSDNTGRIDGANHDLLAPKASSNAGGGNNNDTSPTRLATERFLFEEGVFRPLKPYKYSSTFQTPVAPFAFLHYPPEIMDLDKELANWKKDRKWYLQRNVPWRKGWLFYGEPGTGKTAFIRAIATAHRMPLNVFDLKSMDDKEFREEWKDALRHTPTIVYFPEFDTIFHGRENILGENGGGLSIQTILNCMSGADPANGVLTIIDTNHIEHIDPAIGIPVKDKKDTSSRAGRIDRIVKFDLMTEACRRGLATDILSDWPSLISRVVQDGEGETAAQFSDRCCRIASKLRHAQHIDGVDTEPAELEEAVLA